MFSPFFSLLLIFVVALFLRDQGRPSPRKETETKIVQQRFSTIHIQDLILKER